MPKRFVKDISISTLQVMLNQGLGLLIFILTSRFLTKQVYGEFNWSLALLTFVITILSFRLEQIVVKKIAAGDDASKMLTLFIGHNIFLGLLFYAILFLLSFLFPGFFKQHDLLLILAISQLLSFFSTPFKQVANGKEIFASLAFMSSVSNLVKAIGLLLIVVFSTLTIHQVLILYIIASLAEVILSALIIRYKLKISVSSRWAIKDYFILLKESLPQLGVVFLNALIARFDWILLGLFSTTAITAEYSFAYKVFELCPLPMLIVAPVLLSRLSNYFSKHSKEALLEKKQELSFFLRYAMIAATFLPLILNIIWSPFVDAVTSNKYGTVNKTTFLLLSFCIPFQYLINLLWTIEFAQGHLKRILRITIVTSTIIVVGDAFMIPLLNAKGAAAVYLFATTVEYLVYLRHSILIKIKESWLSLSICVGIALTSGFSVAYIIAPLVIKIIIAIAIYISLLLATRQIKKNDWRIIKEFI